MNDLAELQALCARYQHLLGLDAWDIAVQRCDPMTLEQDHPGARVHYRCPVLRAAISIPEGNGDDECALVHELVELALNPVEEFFDTLAPTQLQVDYWDAVRHQAVVLLADAILGRRTTRDF